MPLLRDLLTPLELDLLRLVPLPVSLDEFLQASFANRIVVDRLLYSLFSQIPGARSRRRKAITATSALTPITRAGSSGSWPIVAPWPGEAVIQSLRGPSTKRTWPGPVTRTCRKTCRLGRTSGPRGKRRLRERPPELAGRVQAVSRRRTRLVSGSERHGHASEAATHSATCSSRNASFPQGVILLASRRSQLSRFAWAIWS